MRATHDRRSTPRIDDDAAAADDDVADEITKTVQLAIGTLDHPDCLDEELERLCEEALAGKPPLP